VKDDEAVLEFVFPDGLPEDERRLLKKDLEILHHQSWSPEAAVSAVLVDWPESEPVLDYRLETAEDRLLEACEQFLAESE